jgi:hypothetical protein
MTTDYGQQTTDYGQQMADNFEYEGLQEAREALEKVLMSRPDMEEKVKALVRKALQEARQEVVAAARGAMGSDPRGTSEAVKMMVYKSVLGGAVSILGRKRKSGGSGGGYEPARKLRAGQRGGNRVPRGQRTQEMMSYSGRDRAMVLRWLNSGTAGRTAGSRDGRLSGNRGRIEARNFFSQSSMRAIEKAAEKMAKELEKLIAD